MEDDSYPPGNFAHDDQHDEEEEEEEEEEVFDAPAVVVGESSSTSWPTSKKRKRDLPDPNAPLTSDQVQAKLHHLNRSLLAQAKKAQTFELQRLHKHKKDAKRDVSKDGELEKAIATLKALSLPTFLASAIHSKLTKTNLLMHYPILVPLVPPPPTPTTPPTQEETKAANRVASNKSFAKEMGEGVKRVRGWVDVEFKGMVKTLARGQEEGEGEEEKGEKGRGKDVGSTSAKDEPSRGRADPSDEEGDNPEGLNTDYFSGGSDEDDSEQNSDEEDDDDDMSQASWSSGSVSSQPPPSSKKSKPSSPAASSKPTKEKPTKVKEKVKPIPKKVTSSLFLPSLSAGYTLGGSDSEPEVLSDDEKGERKNRRGQRARKAIWEKKYGANANHLKAERAAAPGPSSDPYPVYNSTRGSRGGRGGFVQSTRGGPSGRGRGGGTFIVPTGTDGGWGAQASAGAASSSRGGAATTTPSSRGGLASRGGGRGGAFSPAPARAAAGGEKKLSGGEGKKEMHPSWVAKQKLKEKQSATAAPAGKKITFD